MVFCILLFVYIYYFGESSLQLIEVLQFAIHISLPKIDVTNSRPETIFNQMGEVSAKVGVVKQTCVCPPPPRKNPV